MAQPQPAPGPCQRLPLSVHRCFYVVLFALHLCVCALKLLAGHCKHLKRAPLKALLGMPAPLLYVASCREWPE